MKPKPPEHFKATEFGFEWQAAKVQRLFSDPRKGWVTVGVDTPKAEVQVYVTKTGKVRVWINGKEAKV
jgi:hypothetical protein